MIGRLFPRCPVGTGEKVWVERRMLWLADRFGVDRMRTAVVVEPTAAFLPADYEPTEAAARECFDRVCGHMGIDPAGVELLFADMHAMPGAAGLYEQGERSRITVSRYQLDLPAELVSTLAHELAHELLLKGGKIDRDEPDHELVTDLLPTFLGLGIFTANTTVQAHNVSDGRTSYFSIYKHGYLSSVVLGYALAVFAYVRGERRPAWARHLRTDARVVMADGLRYLVRTGDCLFAPAMDRCPPPPDAAALAAALAHRRPGVRLNALREMEAVFDLEPDLHPAVERLITDRDLEVRCAAIETLARFGEAAHGAVPQLMQAAWYGVREERKAAATALGALTAHPADCVPALAKVLGDPDDTVAAAAVDALSRYGPAAGPPLLDALGEAAAVADLDRVARLAAALRAAVPDARRRVKDHFRGRDAEEIRTALWHFRE